MEPCSFCVSLHEIKPVKGSSMEFKGILKALPLVEELYAVGVYYGRESLLFKE